METLKQKMRAKGYLPAPRVAELVGLSVYTVYRWIKAGDVKGEKMLGHWFVTAESLIAKVGPDKAELLGLSGLADEEPHAVAGS